MPLNRIILQNGFLDIIQNPPSSPVDAARKMAKVYANYAKTGWAGLGPGSFTGSEESKMANTLAGGFNPRGAAPAAVGGLLGGITAFWLTPPVVFSSPPPGQSPGFVSAFAGAAALQSALSALANPKIAAGQAAAQLATAFDAATRQVLVTFPPGGNPSPVILPVV